ncbi:hypothetical protein AHF37_11466 [Paragonimus kellicotti]|nr:hypothetical protein AHF37_11466 [Paragonimus kellicotti]
MVFTDHVKQQSSTEHVACHKYISFSCFPYRSCHCCLIGQATKRVKSVDVTDFHKPIVYMSVTSREESATTSIQNPQEITEPTLPSNDLSGDLTAGNIATVQMKTGNTTVFQIRDRALLIVTFSIILVVCLTCRCTLHWSNYFGFYCIYPNGTFLSLIMDRQL